MYCFTLLEQSPDGATGCTRRQTIRVLVVTLLTTGMFTDFPGEIETFQVGKISQRTTKIFGAFVPSFDSKTLLNPLMGTLKPQSNGPFIQV